jgi:N-acetylglucosamine kinase-like BadF-type ATPase
MPTAQSPKKDKKIPSNALFLGVDGGGTKTLAVVTGAKLNALGEGKTGASNPMRVGVERAIDNIVSAIDRACDAAEKSRFEIVSAEIGLAGVRRADLRELIRERLMARLNIKNLQVVTDAEIALYGATNGSAGLVIIAGTGSICRGRNAAGETAAAGGWGPIAGDEGGGAGIAKRALQAVAKASDGRAEKTVLSELACDYFRAATPEDLAMAIYAPGVTNERIAGFAKLVIEAARNKDAVALALLDEAGCELGLAANAVIKRLNMADERFQVAFVGSVFKAKELIFATLLRKIHELAPAAFLAPPQLAPAVAAAKMAFENYRK